MNFVTNGLDRCASGDINRLEVPVPPGTVDGSTLSLSTPDGGKLKLTIPAGVPVGANLILVKDETGWKCSAVWDDCDERNVNNYNYNSMPSSVHGHHSFAHQKPQKSLSYQPPISVTTPTSTSRLPRTPSFSGRPHLTPYAQRMAQFPPLDSGVLAAPSTPLGFTRNAPTTPLTPAHRTLPFFSNMSWPQPEVKDADNLISHRSATSQRAALISNAALPQPGLPHSTTEHGCHNGLHPALADRGRDIRSTSPHGANEQPTAQVTSSSASDRVLDDVHRAPSPAQDDLSQKALQPSPDRPMPPHLVQPESAQHVLPVGGFQHPEPPEAHKAGLVPQHVMTDQRTALYSIPAKGLTSRCKSGNERTSTSEDAVPRPHQAPFPFGHISARPVGLAPPRPLSIPPARTTSYVPAAVGTPRNRGAAPQTPKFIRPLQPQAHGASSGYGPMPSRYGPPPPMVHPQLRQLFANRLSLRGVPGTTCGAYSTTPTATTNVPFQRVDAVQPRPLENVADAAQVKPVVLAQTAEDTAPHESSSRSEQSHSDSQPTEPAVSDEKGGDGGGAAKHDTRAGDPRSGAFGWSSHGSRDGGPDSSLLPAQDLVSDSTMENTSAPPVIASHGLAPPQSDRTHFQSGVAGCMLSRQTEMVAHHGYAVQGTNHASSVVQNVAGGHGRPTAMNGNAVEHNASTNVVYGLGLRREDNSAKGTVVHGQAGPAPSVNNDATTAESSRKSSEAFLEQRNPLHAPANSFATHLLPEFMTKFDNQYAPRKSFPSFSSHSVAAFRQPLLPPAGASAFRLDSSSALQGQWLAESCAGAPLTQ